MGLQHCFDSLQRQLPQPAKTVPGCLDSAAQLVNVPPPAAGQAAGTRKMYRLIADALTAWQRDVAVADEDGPNLELDGQVTAGVCRGGKVSGSGQGF